MRRWASPAAPKPDKNAALRKALQPNATVRNETQRFAKIREGAKICNSLGHKTLRILNRKLRIFLQRRLARLAAPGRRAEPDGTKRNRSEPWGTKRNETEPLGTIGNRRERLGTGSKSVSHCSPKTYRFVGADFPFA